MKHACHFTWRRHIAFAVVLGALIGFGTSVAHAATATSQIKQFNVAGRGYLNYAGLTTGGGGDAFTEVQTSNAGNVCASCLGAKARVFWDNGTLCNETVFSYTTSSSWRIRRTFPGHNCGGYIYSQGRSAVWNGSEFLTQATERTVNLYG